MDRTHEQYATGANAASDEGAIVHEWPKNQRETVRVTISSFRGRDLIDLRAYYEAEDGSMRPTRKGIAFGTEQFAELEFAVERLRALLPAEARSRAER
jgi:hypothetical protein